MKSYYVCPPFGLQNLKGSYNIQNSEIWKPKNDVWDGEVVQMLYGH